MGIGEGHELGGATKGYGLSNNPQVSGPPAFDDAVFELSSRGEFGC